MKYQAPFGSPDPEAGYVDKNVPGAVSGSRVPAKAVEHPQREIVTVLTNAGLVPSEGDLTQLWQALSLMLLPGFAGRLSWMPVLSLTTTAPPGAPVKGDCYIIPAGGTGAWAGQSQKLAVWTGNSWAIVATKDGHGVSLPDGRVYERIAGTYVEKLALDVQTGKWSYGVAGGTANAITVALVPAPAALVEGLQARIRVTAANTDAVTVNANGLGVLALKRSDGADLQKGELSVGQVIEVIYDGAAWQMVNFSGGERTRRRAYTGLWSQSLADGVLTKITAFTDLDRDLAGTAFTAGVLTVGASDAGLWEFIFSAVSPTSNLEMFAAISQSSTGSGAISYNAAQTANGAPGTTASIVVRLVAGDNMSFTVRQISGAARVFSGRVAMCRIGG